MSLPSTRPASTRLHTSEGHVDVCDDCKGALRRNGFLLDPQCQGEPLRASDVRREAAAPAYAVCDWCV